MKICNETIDLATLIIKAAYSFRATSPADLQPVVTAVLHMERTNGKPIVGTLMASCEDGSTYHVLTWTHVDPLRLWKSPDAKFIVFRPPDPESRTVVSVEWNAQSFAEFSTQFMSAVIVAMEAIQ